MRRRAIDRFLTQLVRRAERVEHQTGVRQEILAPLLLQAQRIGKHRQRIGFGEVGDGIKAAAHQQFLDLGFRKGREMGAERPHRGRRQNLIQHVAGTRMRRRVRLQDNALRAPRLLLGKIA